MVAPKSPAIPRALADALAKIHHYASGIPMETAEAHPETAQMMIMNPLSGHGMAGWFSTHPVHSKAAHRTPACAGARRLKSCGPAAGGGDGIRADRRAKHDGAIIAAGERHPAGQAAVPPESGALE